LEGGVAADGDSGETPVPAAEDPERVPPTEPLESSAVAAAGSFDGSGDVGDALGSRASRRAAVGVDCIPVARIGDGVVE
jgi:hypothetical protein